MRIVPPAVCEQVLEVRFRENATEEQLAERFNLPPNLVGEILIEGGTAPQQPIKRGVMTIAREFYRTMPGEIAGFFCGRVENISGAGTAHLAAPGH